METPLLVKKTKRRTVKKSRTIARSALRHKPFQEVSLFVKAVFGLTYGLSVFVLFQFVSVPFVMGFYDTPLSQTVEAALRVQRSRPTTQRVIGIPARLKIPSIGVNAPIGPIGLMPDKSMGAPKRPLETAWYKLGPKPGEKGSAVIAGHINWWYGVTGVFEGLHKLKPGDKINVHDDKGTEMTFVVREIREYGAKDNAGDVFYSFDGKAHLNLVTCAGFFDRLSQKYSKRLVVFTDQVTE